jgi:hypothetical protein
MSATGEDANLGKVLDLLGTNEIERRVLAVAFNMAAQGRRPSLQAASKLAGISRQAMGKSHRPVADIVVYMGELWRKLPSEIEEAREDDREASARALKALAADLRGAKEERNLARQELVLAMAIIDEHGLLDRVEEVQWD